jgi:hypothetical protein
LITVADFVARSPQSRQTAGSMRLLRSLAKNPMRGANIGAVKRHVHEPTQAVAGHVFLVFERRASEPFGSLRGDDSICQPMTLPSRPMQRTASTRACARLFAAADGRRRASKEKRWT